MTDLSRRTILGAGAVGLAVGMVGLVGTGTGAGAAQAAQAAQPQRALYSRSRYLRLRGRRFDLVGPGGRRTTARLVEVDDLPFAPHGSERAFVLTFRSASRGPAQGTFVLRRRGFDRTSLFLVAGDESRRTYHAVVDRRG